MLAFSTGSSFPRGFSSLYRIAVLKSSGDKNMDNSTKVHSHEERSQHSPPGRDRERKMRTKIKKPEKFLYTRNGVSELLASYVK